ncbi:MAG: hypothetical protein E7166_04875 [Firmicutes bacterium]|nr:hypothetical protein [Bacillota bacterium]
MFDNELKQLFDNIQYKLKSNSETTLSDIEQEISSIRKRVVTKIGDILSYNGISFDLYKLEGIVEDYLSNELKQFNKKFLVENFQKLATFNSSVQGFISQQAKQQTDKSKKEQTVEEMMKKMDYTMSEYKKITINLNEQFNKLFKKILKENPLYDRPQAVEDIKRVLTSEMKAAQEYLKDKRNQIVTSNTTLIIESSKRLSEHTDYVSTTMEQPEQVVEQIKKVEESIDREIQTSYEQDKSLEETNITQTTTSPKVEYQSPIQTEKRDDVSVVETNNDDYKTLYAPSFKSFESQMSNQSNEEKQNYRILEDGTIEWKQDPRKNMFTDEEIQMFNSQSQAPTIVDNEIRIIDAVKNQMNQHVWKDIGLYATRTDTTIDNVSNEMLREVSILLQQNGIPNNPNITMQIIQQLNSELKEVNNNLSANMVTTFTNINNATMDSISQTFSMQPDVKEQEVQQCLDVYLQTTQLRGFHLNCSNQFGKVVRDICSQYGIKQNSPQFIEITRIVESKRIQVESQLHNMFNDFSNSNANYISNTIGSTMLSQQYVQGLQQELTPQQIQMLLDYNRTEIEKNYSMEQMHQDVVGMSR